MGSIPRPCNIELKIPWGSIRDMKIRDTDTKDIIWGLKIEAWASLWVLVFLLSHRARGREMAVTKNTKKNV